jgi:hypothetical protein
MEEAERHFPRIPDKQERFKISGKVVCKEDTKEGMKETKRYYCVGTDPGASCRAGVGKLLYYSSGARKVTDIGRHFTDHIRSQRLFGN